MFHHFHHPIRKCCNRIDFKLQNQIIYGLKSHGFSFINIDRCFKISFPANYSFSKSDILLWYFLLRFNFVQLSLRSFTSMVSYQLFSLWSEMHNIKSFFPHWSNRNCKILRGKNFIRSSFCFQIRPIVLVSTHFQWIIVHLSGLDTTFDMKITLSIDLPAAEH